MGTTATAASAAATIMNMGSSTTAMDMGATPTAASGMASATTAAAMDMDMGGGCKISVRSTLAIINS